MFCPFLVNTPGISCTETENRPVQYHSFYHHSKLKNKTYLTKIMPQCPKYLCINGPDTPQSPISVHECYAYQQSYLTYWLSRPLQRVIISHHVNQPSWPSAIVPINHPAIMPSCHHDICLLIGIPFNSACPFPISRCLEWQCYWTFWRL